LASCSFNKHGLILIIFGKRYRISTLLETICMFNFHCLFIFPYFSCF